MAQDKNKRKKKLAERKKNFEVWKQEQAELAYMKRKIAEAFPDKAERQAYIKALIEEFDRATENQQMSA